MLTRLKVTGFKNLVDTEVRFGPFTCIAGTNGVGKSNVFDAIRFLALLADHTFVDAARQVRGGADPASLFTAWGDGLMRFECDVVVPAHGKDDFHQAAEASHTYLTYSLALQLNRAPSGAERIELQHEALTYIPLGGAPARLGFECSQAWLTSAIRKSHRRAKYIETMDVEGQRRVRLSADKMRDEDKSKRGGGKPTDFLASTLPRTVLSAASHAEEARTAVLVRAEMRSWRVLQLEPSSLRVPDELHAPSTLTVEGRHLPATLYRLASGPDGDRIVADISNRLAQLVSDVRELRVVRDDTRRALQLVLTKTAGQEFPAALLSDGTLRFVALSVLERDREASGLFCLEEPENGIHPERMGAMMRLLTDMATDPTAAVDDDNLLQQVIISTHSPIVVSHTRPDDLLFADHRDPPGRPPSRHHALVLRSCGETWRAAEGAPETVGKGTILEYLGALAPGDYEGLGPLGPTIFSKFGPQLALRFEAET
ncbi:MAG: AAA family ATPase [Polyangiaceae bacterium]|nr:AAA family ATPase [Polyangiaceae bacterium]